MNRRNFLRLFAGAAAAPFVALPVSAQPLIVEQPSLDLLNDGKGNKTDIMVQLYQKGAISRDALLKEVGIDYNVEVRKIREEQRRFNGRC